MNVNVDSKFKPQFSRRTVLGVSLLVVLLLTSLAIGILIIKYRDAYFENAIPVKNEEQLRKAVNNTPSRRAVIIALGKDISLSSKLIIPKNKDITLTSNKAVGYYKLIGADGESTIWVDGNGVLKLDGIIVTHEKDKEGSGITVDPDGKLIMHSGEISGNTVMGIGMPSFVGGYSREGGGVYNKGIFEMYGGKISNNLASVGSGGGVYNGGTFKLSGGEISNNKATTAVFTESDTRGHGGGVYNSGKGTFTMSGGKITKNTAVSDGGGVNNWGTFTMLGGEITNNTAEYGGVYNGGTFNKQGGTISNNRKSDVYNWKK